MQFRRLSRLFGPAYIVGELSGFNGRLPAEIEAVVESYTSSAIGLPVSIMYVGRPA